jgi:hypothetical protein
MSINVNFTQNELVAIFQLCRNYKVGLYTDEYYLIKGIMDKIISSGVLNNAGASGTANPQTVTPDTPADITGV